MDEVKLHEMFCIALNSLGLPKEKTLFGVSDEQDNKLFELREAFDKFILSN